MSQYDDYDGARDRRSRPAAPYPDEDDIGDRRSRTGRDAPAGSQVGGHKADIPPPPLGSAMKREGSRSRVPAHLRPDFPDEASYLNARSPDLERKNGERDRKFRERRGGYESDEGEQLKDDIRRRRSQRGQPPPYDDDRRGNRSDNRSEVPVRGGRDRRDYPEDRRRDYDDRRRPARDYDDRRRRHDDDYDDRGTELPPRRRGPRDGVEYGADPIKPARRSYTDRPARDGRDDRDRRGRNNRYDDDDDDEYRNRRKSLPPRRSDRYDDDDYDRDRDRRRRDDDYGRDRDDRRPRRRRSHDDYDDDYDRRDRRDRRDGRDRKEPTQLKFGNVDLGPAFDKGQKYYSTVAPILTPLVMNYLKNKK